MDFTVEELSAAIEILPTRYGRITQLGLFRPKPQTNNLVQIACFGEIVYG